MKIGILTVRDENYHPNAGLLKAARERGHTPYLINPYRVTPQIFKGRALLAGVTDGGLPDLVFPRQGSQVGDASLTLIRQLGLMGIPLVNNLESILLARNQFLTLQVLAGAGVATPDSFFINAMENMASSLSDLGGYPVVVKTVSGRQGEGIFLLSSESESQAVVARILEPSQGLVIQRFIPPEGRSDYRILVIKDKVAAAMSLKPAPGEFRSNIHLNGRAETVSLPVSLAKVAVKASNALGLDVSGVDLVVDANGRVEVLEVNYSPGFRGIEAVTGLDIAGMIIDCGVSLL